MNTDIGREAAEPVGRNEPAGQSDERNGGWSADAQEDAEGAEAAQEDAEGAESAEEGAEGAEEGSEDARGRDPLGKARSEAKNLRSRLKSAEAERDALRETLGVMRRGEVVRLATGHGKLADGADLFLAGVDLGDLLGEDGAVDPGKVDAAVARVLTDKPYWRAGPRTPRPDRAQRQYSANVPGGVSWQAALGQPS